MPSYPSAIQTYKPQNKPKDRVIRSAQCPLHSKAGKDGKPTGAPGKYRSVQPSLEGKEYWAFACHYLGVKKEHIFLTLPDPTAPTKTEEVDGWIKAQQMKQIVKAEAKRQ